ncbi:MAG: selenoneine biosynthesis selenosugar synthase SenB [Gammaproteobacteria bacterium]|nr:selenoneine biosynthesis selenosugar synthase SenB [Gammaproteobacteria bacterium]
MNIILITPARPASRSGNRATASRWAAILRMLGHRVVVATEYSGKRFDLMIALHAWRSADAIDYFARRYPDQPLIVTLTGTDAYKYIHSHSETTLRSIQQADWLVGLHDLIGEVLNAEQRHKLWVIHQSAKPLTRRNPYQRYFHVSVMGHLREEKDPLRPALAARLLPERSRIQIHQYGRAHNDQWSTQASQEMRVNARYHWHGELPHYRIRRVYQRTNLLALPSRMEGGANVISEALMADVPVVASSIAGSIGLLGKDYPGYYPLEDEQALARLLLRCETEPAFYRSLVDACRQRRHLFSQQQELESWRKLMHKVTNPGPE